MNILTKPQRDMIDRVLDYYREEEGKLIKTVQDFPPEPLEKVFSLNPHSHFNENVGVYLAQKT